MIQAVERHFTGRGRGLEFAMEADWVRRHLRTGCDRIVDVGCGNGVLIRLCRGRHRVGVDISFEGLRCSGELRDCDFICGHAENVPLADASADAVIAQHVLEHLCEPIRACTEWQRVLRSGGILSVLTPNREFRDPSVFDDDTHVTIFDRVGLATVIAAAGFEILDLRTLGLPWFRRGPRWPGYWRLRRATVTRAEWLANWPMLRWKGQTLCCLARKT